MALRMCVTSLMGWRRRVVCVTSPALSPAPVACASTFESGPEWGVGVSKVGGIFVHHQQGSLFLEKSTFVICEEAMPEASRPDQQAAAQALVAELQQLVEEELREMVATLQQAEP